MTRTIYLDHNSTTPMDASVAQLMSECYVSGFVNPASQHRLGQEARKRLEQYRQRICQILGAQWTGMQTDQLVFTSGGTESNNLALLGLVQAQQPVGTSGRATGRVLISAIEHPSVIGAAEQLVRLGYQVEKIPVDQSGTCRLDALDSMLDQPTILVSLMLANNETGVIQPVAEAAALCRQRGVLVHTDAVQAVGKIPVDFRGLGVDAMTFTGHKLNGPRGIGGLLLLPGVTPHPQMFGGFQQMAIRPGTEDVALAAGLCQALELYDQDRSGRFLQTEQLRDQLEQGLMERIESTVINGNRDRRLPHTLNVSFPGIDRQSFLLAADWAGLAISTGSACASGSSELSPVLLAMGLEKEVVEGSIRISLGVSTTPAEIDETLIRIVKIVSDLRARK